jgi:hypothetical protein
VSRLTHNRLVFSVPNNARRTFACRPIYLTFIPFSPSFTHQLSDRIPKMAFFYCPCALSALCLSGHRGPRHTVSACLKDCTRLSSPLYVYALPLVLVHELVNLLTACKWDTLISRPESVSHKAFQASVIGQLFGILVGVGVSDQKPAARTGPTNADTQRPKDLMQVEMFHGTMVVVRIQPWKPPGSYFPANV